LVFGMVGILVATPLTVVVFIMVRLLYLEDTLGASDNKAPQPDCLTK